MASYTNNISFDFSFPSPSIEEPITPPDMGFAFDPSCLELPYNHSHSRSASQDSSIYSVVSGISTVDSIADSLCSRFTTPPRAASPVRQHGPLLLPKIRSQDQDMTASGTIAPMPKRVKKKKAALTPPPSASSKPSRPSSHVRSFTNPESLSHVANVAYATTSFSGISPDYTFKAPLLCSPAPFAHESSPCPDQYFIEQQARRASSCNSYDGVVIDPSGYEAFRQGPWMSTSNYMLPIQQDFVLPMSSYTPRAGTPQSLAVTPDPTPAPRTTLAAYLSAPNPAASLVRNISFPLRDPNTKHFWWDIRSVKPWTGFNAATVFGLPGASSFLTSPVAASLLPTPAFGSRQPETEAALHASYAAYYLPKLNAALAVSSPKALQMSVSNTSKNPAGPTAEDLLFVANAPGDAASAAAMFGGKPGARIVGLVRSFDRFNTGMRNEGNIKRVEYLRGLAAIHHAMREHGCRYGFIMTEIELVVVRNSTEAVPFFGELDVTSFQLASTSLNSASSGEETPLSACLALWGLCQLAMADELPAGHVSWRANIGAPAEGTRRKARARDTWMPPPQLAEKRAAKRSRGWVWPEDAIGRKELGKRGVRYGGIY